MKAIMGFLFFLLFLAGIAFVMLQGRQMASIGGSGAEITDKTWRAVSIGGDKVAEDSGLNIRFEVDGSLKGHGGCNSFFGSLEKSDAGIKVGPLGGTRMACPDAIMAREAEFMGAVQQMENYQAGSNTMSLLDKDGEVLATFVSE